MANASFLYTFLIQPLASLVLFIFGFGLVEEHTLPDSMAPGSSFVASWTIEQGSASGFARLQISFPPGMEVSPIETQNASFTFERQKAKLIWMDVPSSPSLHIKLRIVALPEFQGGNVTQRFSFIQNGTRQDVEFEPHVISLDWGESVSENAAIEQNPEVHVSRNIAQTENNVARMDLDIRDFVPGTFMKIEEIIPTGCDVEWIHDGEPSIKDRYGDTLLLVWQHAPNQPRMRLSYRVSGDLASCSSGIHGHFYSVKNNQKNHRFIPPIDDMDFNTADVAEENPTPESLGQIEEAQAEKQPLNPEVQSTSSGTPPSPKRVIPEPDAGIAFRVQVLAGHRDVSQAWFAKKFNFHNQVDAERHENWIKYTTGNHGQYESARDSREQIRRAHALPGPFVTAYLDGERVTVQEALLVSQQNWTP
ncbi:MAG: hypothetical protein P8K81_04955 [Flavobacteriales bacterium]|jgi:hypothetical protein|nr:hypothetical protein [Flavobacteriales bacterium]